MEDLYKVLVGMEEPSARGLADRIEKFVRGSLVGIFDQQSNMEITNHLTVFSIRDLEDELRPIAMYLILDFIWTKIRKSIKRRVLIVDEAWYLMKYPDSAQFLNSIAKRSRKYYLGLTTITQDVEDFLAGDLGKTIIQNSSIQILLKQSTAAIDRVAKVFYLSEGEKHLLLSSDIGQGLLFAGPAHAAIRVIASPEEHALATTKPQEMEKQKQDLASLEQKPTDNRPMFTVETVTPQTK
jgi:type IV secretory pathway VirB4 component